MGVVEEFLEALIVQLVAALTRPGDSVQVQRGAANGARFPLGGRRRNVVGGVETVCHSCLEQGVHSCGLIEFFLRFRAEPASSAFAFAPKLRVLFPALAFCLTVYALNLLPYMLVHRSCFIYHYMPALAFATILVARVYEQLTPLAYRAAVFKALVAAAAAVFVHFAPWVYALPVLPEAHDRRRWLPRWT